MRIGRVRRALRRVETLLLTGPAGHFAGGALDLLEAFSRYALARARGRPLR